MSRAIAARRSYSAVVPGVALAILALLALAAGSGGFYVTGWGAAALFLLGLTLATVLAVGVPRPPRAVVAAIALLALLALWSYLSIAWASQAGAAWEGANRTLLFLLIFALFAAWPLGEGGLRLVPAVAGLGVAALGLVELVRVDAAADPVGFFIGARLSEPVGYINGNAALWTVGLMLCLGLSSARETPVAVRALAMGGAPLLAGLALMAQSRGWLLTLPLALVVLVGVVPGRLRLLGALALVAGATALVAEPLLAVHDDFRPGRLAALVDDAAPALLACSAALAAIGALWGLADRRVRVGERAGRALGVAVALLAAAGLVAGTAALLAAERDPAERVEELWSDFKRGGEAPRAGESRLSAATTNRYDFWRVAWDVFGDHPVAGIGVENFQEEYLVRGRSGEQPRYAHSLELGLLSQLGLPGLLLGMGALGAALAAALRARAAGPGTALPAALCIGAFVYWLLHASIDWLWEVAAVTGLAIALLGAAAGAAPRPEAAPRRLGRRGAVGAGVAGALAAAVLALPWLAELYIDRAAKGWVGDPDGAQRQLDRADALNPLSPRPRLTSATIALRLGRTAAAERAFRRALEREPTNVYPVFELGLIAGERGQRARALRWLRRARRLSPRNDLVRAAIEDVRRGREISVAAVNREILRRARLYAR